MSKLILGLVVATLAAFSAAAPQDPAVPPTVDTPRGSPESPIPSASLDPIKKLIGTWVAVEDGKPTDQVVSVYRLTAGGSAVLETIFPGADHEMITVYYLDGNDLVLTHYCAMRNQPHMKAKRGTPSDQLVFECQGGDNIGPDTAHMHRGEYQFLAADRMRTRWTAIQKGETVHEVEFELARRKKTGTR